MLKITWSVTLEDEDGNEEEPYTVHSKSRDYIDFERHFDRSASALSAKKGPPLLDANGAQVMEPAIANGEAVLNAAGEPVMRPVFQMDSSHIRQEWLDFLAYRASRRAGKFVGDLEAFLDRLVVAQPIAQDAAVPTNAGA